MSFAISRTVDNGIERIIYTPANRRFETPILMQHGMWHAAWCWQPWQELFAEWGWETIAFSLPGHGASPMQRPIRWCTLGYYFQFLQAEIDRLPQRPVLMGHSMGGALTQWYLKYGGDLPAAVLVAPWTSHRMMQMKTTLLQIRIDPLGQLLSWLTFSATPAVRTPERAFKWFLTEGAIISAEDLHRQLGPESGLVLLQYQPPFWSPATQTNTPLLWLAAEQDLCILEEDSRPSAAYYGADYVVVPAAGHDLMFERSFRETAETIHQWLSKHIAAIPQPADSPPCAGGGNDRSLTRPGDARAIASKFRYGSLMGAYSVVTS